MITDRHRELHERARTQRWEPTEDRLQTASELALLVEDARHYDALLETAAPMFARHVGGACIIALLSDDGAMLHPLGIHHADRTAREQLERLSGMSFRPLGESQRVLNTGRGHVLTLDRNTFAERPGVGEYLDLTGDRHALVAPLLARGRSAGVVWLSTARQLDDDDVHFVTMCASRLALAVEHLRLVEGDVLPKAPTDDGPLADLTAREREILALVAAGMTSREAAEHLVVSVRTVEWHRARLQSKLGLSGRSELTRIAREAGLSPPIQ